MIQPSSVKPDGQTPTTQASVPDARARQLSGLIPFKPGYDPRRNNGGAPGASLVHNLQNLAREDASGHAVYSADDLQAMVDNPRTPHMKAAAARQLLGTRKDGFAPGGRPFAIEDVRELLDREMGKPHQRVMVQTQTIAPLSDVQAAMGALLEAHPGLRLLLEQAGGQPQLPSATPASPKRDGDA